MYIRWHTASLFVSVYVYVYVFHGKQITIIKARCYEYTRTRWRERRNFGFARNGESEKNERNDEVSKEYVQTRVRKRISQKKRTRPDNIQAKVCEDLNKIISPIQDKISLLLLLSKIVLKFINFHTHFAVRLPQQRFFFFLITVIQLIT